MLRHSRLACYCRRYMLCFGESDKSLVNYTYGVPAELLSELMNVIEVSKVPS